MNSTSLMAGLSKSLNGSSASGTCRLDSNPRLLDGDFGHKSGTVGLHTEVDDCVSQGRESFECQVTPFLSSLRLYFCYVSIHGTSFPCLTLLSLFVPFGAL